MSSQKPMVLICDDSMLIRKKMRTVLETLEQLELNEAANGQEAVDFCKSTPVQLVFMDIVMPQKDGIEALQEIKAANPDTIIIMASSVGTETNLRKALQAGADDFIQKPISAEEVERMIMKYIIEREEQSV